MPRAIVRPDSLAAAWRRGPACPPCPTSASRPLSAPPSAGLGRFASPSVLLTWALGQQRFLLAGFVNCLEWGAWAGALPTVTPLAIRQQRAEQLSNEPCPTTRPLPYAPQRAADGSRLLSVLTARHDSVLPPHHPARLQADGHKPGGMRSLRQAAAMDHLRVYRGPAPDPAPTLTSKLSRHRQPVPTDLVQPNT